MEYQKREKHSSSEYEWLLFLKHDTRSFSRFVIALMYEKEYPDAFVSLYVKKQKETVVPIELIDHDLHGLKKLVTTTFLGTSCIYFLKTPLHECDKKARESVYSFLLQYQGPHIIIVLHDETIAQWAKEMRSITVPSFLSIEDALLLASLGHVSSVVIHTLLKQVTVRGGQIPFHTVCMLIEHAAVLSPSMMQEFVEKMLPVLYVSQKSLFELSGYFFGKNRQFFSLWTATEQRYSLSFWVVFWSEQLAKATLFCAYKKAGKLQEAKTVGHGLPFSFLNKDWQMHSPKRLVEAYVQLYAYDCRFKEGVVVKSLDPWLIAFFNG